MCAFSFLRVLVAFQEKYCNVAVLWHMTYCSKPVAFINFVRGALAKFTERVTALLSEKNNNGSIIR